MATRRTFSRDGENPGPIRCTGIDPRIITDQDVDPGPRLVIFATQTRYYSPCSRHYRKYDYKRPLHSLGDINQSNRSSMTMAHGMPEYRKRSPERSYTYPEPYANNPYDNLSDHEQCRPRMKFEDWHVHYPPSYQSEPRIWPDPYTGNEDWEEHQSYFEDCAELSRWDPRSKLLILDASLQAKPGHLT